MNTIKEFILKEGCCLYRYDIVEPPKEWSTDFKNPEYVYPDTGVKNKIGAFFFFDSYHYAIKTGKCALENEKKKGNSYNGIWITKCEIKTFVKLLDLRDSVVCIELLAALDKKGLDVFSNELNSWDGKPFSRLADIIRPIEDVILKDTKWIYNQEANRKINNTIIEMQKVLNVQNDHIGHLLQLFTDFSNGFYFRTLLQEKGFEGYVFNETNHFNTIEGSDTICVFNSSKFQPPLIVNLNSSKI